MSTLQRAIAANRARETGRRDVVLPSGKKVTHTRQPNGTWLINEPLNDDEWFEYVDAIRL